jgi:hypothetical protein
MSFNLSSVPKLQFFDNDGNPLVGGKLYTYAAGTTTPLATYTDSTGATPNTNPIILDSRGEANVWLAAQSYKFVLKTSTDSTIWTVDNVSNAINVSQILANSGTAGAPPYSFSADTDTGVYLAAVGQLGLTAGGVPFLRGTSTAMTFGQVGGANDVDVTHYGDTTQTGNFTLTGDVNVTGAAVFNEAGADKDFRVEGDTDANLLFVDASTDRVGIGTNTPTVKFDVVGAVLVTGNTTLNGAVVVNETGADVDTRIEGDTDDNLVFVDASTDRVGIGTTTGPSRKLHVQQTSATTNAVTQVLRIDSQSSGTPANGIGVGMEFAVETAALNTEIGATIEAITTDVTAGSEDFDLSFKTMAAGAAAAERFRATSTGLFQFNSGYGSVATAFGCRAWINFNGTGTPAIRGSGNVSSITDNGTGDYTINFTVSMPDANYAAIVTSEFVSNGTNISFPSLYAAGPPIATGSVRVYIQPSGAGGGGAVDATYYCVAIFR